MIIDVGNERTMKRFNDLQEAMIYISSLNIITFVWVDGDLWMKIFSLNNQPSRSIIFNRNQTEKLNETYKQQKV